ncbi:MAG: DUF371 domain-containing protein [Candidatus Bathyarchaeota archaeon]|jgi:hypothetical protein|nr:DUF371 domain-containing protein [Candidatus Bathyarchaeota archaeon A05DMB-5]MDH7557441.1 DUF371 domain-containing protein [Candidatus Bathyarchaeota archaeon]
MKFTETIIACGHENIQATHATTFEVTKEKKLSRKGDCIIAVSANKALADLSSEFKKRLRQDNAKLTILIEAGDIADAVTAFGNSKLILTHPTDIVVRKSSYICNRTLAIQADKAACDLSLKLVEKLKNPKQKVKITLKLII